MTPHGSRRESRPSRPIGLWILTLGLLGSPVIHAGALLLRTRWLNFGSLRLWTVSCISSSRPSSAC